MLKTNQTSLYSHGRHVAVRKRGRVCRAQSVMLVFLSVQFIIGLFCLLHLSNYSHQNEVESPRFRLQHHVKETVHEDGVNIQILDGNEQRKLSASESGQLCPLVPPYLKGPTKLDNYTYHWDQIERTHYLVKKGGRFKPDSCVSRNRVAIIVPYRNRMDHLKKFINNIHAFLQRQQLDYGIFVVELAELAEFNRALTLNVGFLEALKTYDYQCFIFHDVDLIPQNDHNLYTCPDMPRHMSVAVDVLNYTLPYQGIFGGVTAMTKEQFLQVNGFSNKFFGWGGEDDDLYVRILANHMTISRYSADVGRYWMLSHSRQHANTERYYLLRSSKTSHTWKKDGLNTLKSKYRILKKQIRRLFTYILIDVDEKDPVYFTDPKKIVEESLRRLREKALNESLFATENQIDSEKDW